MPWLCRDCLQTGSSFTQVKAVCPNCGSTKVIFHNELNTLSIAHLDCDAFYASIEKRENRDLKNKPVLVGGQGERGVVMAACYVARRFGCRSAMPMFQARTLCPDAVVIRPDMNKYQNISKDIRSLMLEMTPQVEPISIDEAFLDLSGTEKLHSGSPARTLANLKKLIQEKFQITVSIGLSHNKFLAKIASAWKKPDGLTVVPDERVERFLQGLPVNALWGVGPVTARKLRAHGIMKLTDIRKVDESELKKLVGSQANWLRQLSFGKDDRPVIPNRIAKSSGSEHTFPEDLLDVERIRTEIDRIARRAAGWLERRTLGARTVTIKVRYSDFTTVTRSNTQTPADRNPESISTRALSLLERTEAGSRPVRLLGVSVHNLMSYNGSAGSDDRHDPFLWDLPAAPRGS